MEKRSLIKVYHDCGYDESQIINLVKNLKITRNLVYRTVKRLRKTGFICDRKRSGRPRSARTQQLVNKVKCRLYRKPKQSIRKMASQLRASRSTVQRVVVEELGLRPYKKRKAHGLTQKQQAKRLPRIKALLERFADKDLDRLVFSDEKLFCLEEKHNSQNVRVYAASFEDIPEHLRTVERFLYEKRIMIWCGVSKKGKLPLHFVEPGTKINAAYYKRYVLQNVVQPQCQQLYNGQDWTFQQDSAPAHKDQTVQNWCRTNLPDFISTEEWPPYSPDLNPLDYSIWGILEAKVNATRHTSLDSLKAKIVKEWNDLPMEVVRTAIDAWPRRLRAAVRAKGGRFE